MPLLNEVPKEMKRGLGREWMWVRWLWVKKNWKCIVLACVGTIVALVLLIIGIVWYSQRGVCHLVPFFPSLVTKIHIDSKECNYEEFGVMDLSRYKNLKSVVIGDASYKYVNEVKVNGLSKLESVEIGMNSFTQHKDSNGNNPNRHFYVKNCPKLKSLKMGCYSFSDYTMIEIENVDALEVIEIGAYSFSYASLELKSVLIHLK